MSYSEDFKKVLLSEPHVILGKKGVTEDFIAHVSKLFKSNKIIKIKALKSIANSENIQELARQVAELTNSYLIDVRGKIFILSKYPIKKHVK
ncbi:MAG: YhbY family RNA-binding protein [Promethearchaeota archaeon]|nr:MAG: YhbY family RNA-binding protein [Candidatus Lokiarchaeota archaeon]